MRLASAIVGAASLVCLARAGAAPDLYKVIAEIRGNLRSDEAIKILERVYANDRYFTFPRFQRTAEYLAGEMKRLGMERVEIVEAPADGETQAGFWTMPLAWDAESATLEILDESVPAASRMLADYRKIPSSLGMWSGPTPPGGVIAALVNVRSADLERGAAPDLKGKLALLDKNPANVKWLLVKSGALGAVNTFTENPALEDGRQWINAWGDDGWAYTKRSTPLLSFSVTPRQTALLRALLSKGPVRVRAAVNTRYYKGSYPYVTAVVPGESDEEVLTLGHTSEQGAQDNASGVSATIEALATLRRLIASGRLPKPRRTIRVLSMGEMYGSLHYVQRNPERIRRTIAAMCVDTPAASYDLAGTEYTFHMNPRVAADFTDALILKIASSYLPLVGRPWHEAPFVTGTDTYMAAPMINVPTVWGYSGSGVETHHNSEDTPDRVDPRSLRDIATITAAYLYFVANADENAALWLAGLSESRAHGRILDGATNRERIEYALDREKQSVLSVLRLVPPAERSQVRERLAPAISRLERFAALQLERASKPSAARTPSEEDRIVVRRKRFGPIPLDDLPHEQWESQPSGAWAAVPTIALYWCDGRRTLAEAARLTQVELGPSKFDFVSYFKFLRKHGYVDFVE